jgi:hypothetical protein
MRENALTVTFSQRQPNHTKSFYRHNGIPHILERRLGAEITLELELAAERPLEVILVKELVELNHI